MFMLARICLVAALCAPRAAVAQASASAAVAGCYAVRPAVPDSARPPFGMAPVVALGASRDTAYGTGGYEVRPGPPGRRRSLSAAAWRPAGADSVEVWWNTGFVRLTLRLAVAGDTLQGVADWQNDGSGFQHHVQPLTAVRRPCPAEPLAPAS
jgi:hypothetical protein